MLTYENVFTYNFLVVCHKFILKLFSPWKSKKDHNGKRTKQHIIREFPWLFTRKLYLCISTASEFCRFRVVVWICSSCSACWFLTLLSSSNSKSFLLINSAFSDLLCSSSAVIASQCFWKKEEHVNQIRDNTSFQFCWNSNVPIFTSVSSQHCFAICNSWRRDSFSVFKLLRRSHCSSVSLVHI